MDSMSELPIYVNCICKDCDHKWESDAWAKSCPMCSSINITQSAMMSGL